MELSADVVRGEAEGPLLDVEMRWCVKGERRVARTSLRTQIYKHHAATLSVTGGYERELELARTTVADRNIRVWYVRRADSVRPAAVGRARADASLGRVGPALDSATATTWIVRGRRAAVTPRRQNVDSPRRRAAATKRG